MKNKSIFQRNKIKKLLPVFLLALFFLLSANSVSASACSGPIVPCGNDATHPCQFCDLFVVFNNLIKFLLFCLVPPFAVAGIVVAGVYLIFSGGNPTMINQGRDVIKAVIIGLLIVFCAWLLINLFFSFIGVASWTNLQEGWFKINCQ
jgi:type IV secretory pathway VirB2 component (pilin)